jgi:FMN-dependent oxidoreductase (nitrilotriacetate monooxygenase family)
MAKRPEHMVLTMFMITAGYHYDSWRMPGSRMEEWGQLSLIADMVKKAEAAKLDAVFFGDIAGAGKIPGSDPTVSGHYEPITSIGALSALTSRIGMIGTASTTFLPPFAVARQFSGLDSLTGGRVGWNIVTSSTGNRNFGIDVMPSGEDRYRMAAEFIDVVTALWDSWSDKAVVNDRERGIWADPALIRAINHKGEFFSVEGPINMPRSPQGRPVMVQAGSSEAGMNVGARYADAIYTQQPEQQAAIDFYGSFKQKVRSFGRNPDQVKIVPGIVPILGETESDARDLENDLASYVNTDLGRTFIGTRLEMDLSQLDLDEEIPAEWFVGPKVESRSRYEVFRKLSVDEGYTLRDLIHVNARSHGHQTITGTPGQVADRMIDWFDSGACDGFNLNSAFVPGGQELILDLLVPELVSRGYFREEYEGTTLRDHWGLDRPGAWDTRA